MTPPSLSIFSPPAEDDWPVSASWVVVLFVATGWVYLPLSVLSGRNTLYGWDYFLLHARRLTFARNALFSGSHAIPGWYPREMLGTPFRANLQDFPWSPSHLPLLFLNPDVAYTAGIAIAALLSALFTYLFCRRAGLTQLAAVSSAWTFSCAGFFAARIMVGHLSILEGYPALPLLLWLSDRALDPRRAKFLRRDLVSIAFGVACVVTTGHPQLPAYALATTLLYVLWRSRGPLRVQICAANLLGVAVTMAVCWPGLLLIRRSSRILPLKIAANDIVLPWRRLLALFVPGIDGWPDGVRVPPGHPFHGYPHPAYFWDTIAYVGLLPWIAALTLVLMCVARRRLPSSRRMFLGVVGMLALAGALPLLDPLRQALPGTILRSPARLLYVCTFSLSVALGTGIDAFLRWNPFGRKVFAYAAIGLCLAYHLKDLGSVARSFVLPVPGHPLEVPEFEQILARETGDSRVAVSRVLALQISNAYDDPGGFDSIFLAKSYRSLVDLTGAPAGLNEEVMDAALWPRAALQATGVKFLVTWQNRADLELVESVRGLLLYRVSDPAPRAEFIGEVLFPPGGIISRGSTVRYLRPNPDEIQVRSDNSRAGFIYLLEASDPGWSAEVDGARMPILEAGGLGMAVPVSAGYHVTRLRYRTPGRVTGAVLSLLAAGLLVAMVRKIKPETALQTGLHS